MIAFDIAQLVPEFLRNDKNGYAIAKAIEAGLRHFLARAQEGLDCLQNIEKMPEWRLDELAWELGCLYDYQADIEAKRRWISEATPLFSAYGTPQAIYNYLNGFFEQVELEEYWQYHGDPFHFRVTVSGKWTDANEEWTRRAVAQAKNVRSVLDDIAIGSGTNIHVNGEGGLYGRFLYGLTSGERMTGTAPDINTAARLADAIIPIATHGTRGHIFPYPAAGTKPQENTVGGLAGAVIASSAEAQGCAFPYPATGTKPEINTVGALADAQHSAATDGQAAAFSYTTCASDKLCGDEMI